jgi:hypothetical protein
LFNRQFINNNLSKSGTLMQVEGTWLLSMPIRYLVSLQ